MKILVYGLNYAPEVTGIGKYTGEMAEWLAEQGHDVRVITTPPYYPMWKIGAAHRNWYARARLNGVDVIRCPLYVPAGKVTTLKRLVHLTSFSISSSLALLFSLNWRPQIVINVVPALFTVPSALLFCKVSGAKSVLHIQDFESDAMFSLGMADAGRMAKVWAKFERFMLTRCDKVSTISGAMMKNAVAKGADKDRLSLFPNWSEVARFQSVSGVLEYKSSLGLPRDKNIILYSGNLGKKQGLELVVEAAEHLEGQASTHFVICGDGASKQELENLAAEKNLANITFLPLQPYEYLPQLLALADVHLVIQNPGVADAVLPSKLTNILAVGGNAVITANLETELGALAKQHTGIATIVEPQNIKALSDGICAALALPKPNVIAKKYASEFLDKQNVLNKFEIEISQLQ